MTTFEELKSKRARRDVEFQRLQSEKANRLSAGSQEKSTVEYGGV
jgi:hypothetical protein